MLVFELRQKDYKSMVLAISFNEFNGHFIS